MTVLGDILALTTEEKKRQGLVHTPAEIAQQPQCWRETVQILKRGESALSAFIQPKALADNPRARVVFAGAGTSEFVGTSVEQALRCLLRVDCDTRATTDIITSWENIFIPGRDYLVVSFARSGNSPESVAAYDIVTKKVPGARQLVITCNADGALAKRASRDSSAFCLVLPPRTNDNGLAMTSSYSSMAVAAMGLGYLGALNTYESIVEQLCAQAQAVLDAADTIHKLAAFDWKRGVFLGTGALYGAARDGHLKVSELTNGKLMCRYDSYPGLRHGPQVVIGKDTFVLAFVSSGAHARKYELDLLRDLKRQDKFGALLVVGPRLNEGFSECATECIEIPEPRESGTDVYSAPYAIIAAQLFGMFKSMALGLAPDSPCADGVISRVVQGVVIHEIGAE